jgi:hypothetical protein
MFRINEYYLSDAIKAAKLLPDSQKEKSIIAVFEVIGKTTYVTFSNFQEELRINLFTDNSKNNSNKKFALWVSELFQALKYHLTNPSIYKYLEIKVFDDFINIYDNKCKVYNRHRRGIAGMKISQIKDYSLHNNLPYDSIATFKLIHRDIYKNFDLLSFFNIFDNLSDKEIKELMLARFDFDNLSKEELTELLKNRFHLRQSLGEKLDKYDLAKSIDQKEELYADFVARLFTDPKGVISDAPTFYNRFMKFMSELEAELELNKELKEAKSEYICYNYRIHFFKKEVKLRTNIYGYESSRDNQRYIVCYEKENGKIILSNKSNKIISPAHNKSNISDFLELEEEKLSVLSIPAVLYKILYKISKIYNQDRFIITSNNGQVKFCSHFFCLKSFRDIRNDIGIYNHFLNIIKNEEIIKERAKLNKREGT